MSVGRAENHEGVSPAANWEAISLPTAAELVMASATRELGRAVWSTPRMELLRLNQSMIDIDWIQKLSTYRSWAATEAARAGRAISWYFILTV